MLKQIRTGQSERVDVFAVVSAGHVLLAQTDSVFSFCDAVEHFEGLFGDALEKGQ